MFSSQGYFRNVPCPRQYDCGLPVCIFSHDSTPSTPEEEKVASSTAKEYDPFSAGDVSPPPAKRRRLESPSRTPQTEKAVEATAMSGNPASLSPKHDLHTGSKPPKKSQQEDGNAQSLARTAPKPFVVSKPTSMTRTVSPPATKASKKEAPQPPKRKPLKVETLSPREVNPAPAQLKTRLAVLQKLHEQLKVQNDKLKKSDAKWEPLVLNEQELISMTLDEEETAARLGSDIYRNSISQTFLRIKKMTTETWVKFVSDWTGASSATNISAGQDSVCQDLKAAGLMTLDQQIAILRHLRTPLDGLEKFGYVTMPPSFTELAAAKAGLASSQGYETCDRCGTRFQVFPGRDENGKLTSKGACHYHWARANRQAKTEASYPCCNKPQGSDGCSEAETHVFVVKDQKRLATILQFEHTPEKTDVRPMKPVSFDCEMGYTTLGMEVIRVTAVTWPGGKLLFDVLVRTYGEILDLNTRFSGVTAESYSSAGSYSPEPTVKGTALQKVDSPSSARALLFTHITPETPLLGHAIENDLNVIRIIHPFVIDTVLLYPHPRGLPIRYGLKMLSQKYLARGIQTAGAAGHDSKEDAIATGDLVTKKVVEKWKVMRHDGWRFSDGLLMAPEEMRGVGAGGHSML